MNITILKIFAKLLLLADLKANDSFMAAEPEMTERERLEWLIDGIRSSVNKSEVGCYESLVYYLSYPVIHNFDLTNNSDLWEKFEQALIDHYLLEEGEEGYHKFDQPDMVEQGYWWYNPQRWS